MDVDNEEKMETEEELVLDPKLDLARKLFLLRTEKLPNVDRSKIKDDILELLIADKCVPLYESYCEEFGWMVDETKLAEMNTSNEAELKQIEEKIADAIENLGDSEVREGLLAKAEFYTRIGDREKATVAFKETEEKTTAVGQKIDTLFTALRISFARSDMAAVKTELTKAKLLFEEGGDWERKNRLKVYEGLYLMATRDLKKAANLFLDSIATFTATELCSYSTFIFYTVVTSMISLDRVTLKKRVIDAPEILTVIEEMPHLAVFLNSLYNCDYSKFFSAFVPVAEMVNSDMYLHAHYRYFLRSVRVVGYSQFLESYKSVTLDSMATAFGISSEFLDKELCSFISAGRLNCKIDKVLGVIETNRPDAKNALYQTTIKQGDLLLNRIQKLSKVIDF
mmetsp:Transcript_31818/g.38478  ORF Transcript_31818/g.38478 Transcript_31818/m.38478 type:complete len:396 (+) Transcript_31818:151-1338(+)|eukprot:CAMPEP_0197852750 /NCGR_PEP_ID=MMETSP1438-20131217/21297_1 /TAXON_ID=1461541 /ORGANISM="Pterosperma sp., Strain CCMP1384" /LENGTH=395 /DNA_ID=CAMNT_0043466915 /DNA_START=141 /DNA_END=1328 /DNA_ORIENTATION=+